MILVGRYNHNALHALGATVVKDLPDGNTEVLPDGLDISGYQTMLTQIAAIMLDKEATGAIDSDKFVRLLFEINFDQENRVRTLEGRPAITRAQYRTALINTYKAL